MAPQAAAMNIPQLVIVLTSLGLCAAVHAASRFEELTRKFEKPADRAEVITSTFFGGSGTEWLAGGGIQPDGTVVLAGVALGPELDLGVTNLVLGTDTAIGPPRRVPKRNFRGGTELDRNRQPVYEPLAWNHANATAFIARLSPDLKSVRSVTRFAWQSGGLTEAAVDSEGNIFVCGPATARITSVSADAQELPVPETGLRQGSCAQVYLAKISPGGEKAIWVRTMRGPSGAPGLRLGKNGKIFFTGQDIRTFDAAGKQLSVTTIAGGLTGPLAVSPVDGKIARGGEHHWSTGREPYRDPILNVFNADGSWLYELYNWDGPFVGLNSLRLVSDSAIRGVACDDDGSLVLHAWSDGGNSVMYREPMDVYTVSKKFDAMGFSAWGAGVLSCAYVIRINPQSYRVDAGTLWVGYLADRNKPNSVTIDSLGFASDRSICVGGKSAWGLIQTGNAFPGDPTGNYVAVMDRDLKSLRFSSILPGTGQTVVSERTSWGIASGTLNGKPVALFLSGATADEGGRATPVANARQEKFGGGFSDGHVLMLDLSPRANQGGGK